MSFFQISSRQCCRSEKCCKTRICLQKSVPIQPKSSKMLPNLSGNILTSRTSRRSRGRLPLHPPFVGLYHFNQMDRWVIEQFRGFFFSQSLISACILSVCKFGQILTKFAPEFKSQAQRDLERRNAAPKPGEARKSGRWWTAIEFFSGRFLAPSYRAAAAGSSSSFLSFWFEVEYLFVFIIFSLWLATICRVSNSNSRHRIEKQIFKFSELFYIP